MATVTEASSNSILPSAPDVQADSLVVAIHPAPVHNANPAAALPGTGNSSNVVATNESVTDIDDRPWHPLYERPRKRRRHRSPSSYSHCSSVPNNPLHAVGKQYRYKHSPAPRRLSSLTPPSNFGSVLPEAIYRSAYPEPHNFSFLQSLHIRTIIVLVGPPGPSKYLRWINKPRFDTVRKMACYSYNVAGNTQDADVVKQSSLVRNIIDKILDPRNHPVLVHGHRGVHRTGVVMGCLECVLGRPMEEVMERYAVHAGGQAREADVQFIRAFDVELNRKLAREWLWAYQEFYGVTPPWLVSSSGGPESDARSIGGLSAATA